MQAAQMKLKVLLPYKVFIEQAQVMRIIAVTNDGAFGIFPHRLDCVIALSAGILVFETQGADEVYIAVDEGILVKTGFDVLISVRNAISGIALAELREAIELEFIKLDEQEKKLRSVLVKIESGFIRRLVTFKQKR